MQEPNSKDSKVIIWDLPTRVFHWLLVASFATAWLSFDDNRFLFFHVFGGYVFFGLLVFRLIWGMIGSHYARFRSFAHDWPSVTAYLKGLLNGTAMRHIGHNPVAGWAIFFMLFMGLIVSISGLLTLGGEEGHGPLKHLVNFTVGFWAHDIHQMLAWSLFAFLGIHVAGVIVESLIHRDNLVWAMITGRKEAAAGAAGVRGHHLLGLTIVLIVSSSALVYFRGYLTETADHLYQPYKGPELPDSAAWREDCGECHLAFHPTLLPARSWKKLLEDQHDHFGDDLDLDEERIPDLLEFHTRYAAESALTEPARKILYYTPPDKTPIRITKTRYWKGKHHDIPDKYWKSEKVKTKTNCGACHLDAHEGTYEDSDMRLPDLGKDSK